MIFGILKNEWWFFKENVTYCLVDIKTFEISVYHFKQHFYEKCK